jgi:hypothetical protein
MYFWVHFGCYGPNNCAGIVFGLKECRHIVH